jgi:hypothetical protein
LEQGEQQFRLDEGEAHRWIIHAVDLQAVKVGYPPPLFQGLFQSAIA